MTPRLGRLARSYNPRIPHYSAITAGKALAPPPPSCDWTVGMPSDLGMLGNDVLGDCTCAGFYHAIQVWQFNIENAILPILDSNALQLYIEACGYDPKQGGEGPGGVEQDVLSYLLRVGAPMEPANQMRNKLAGFVEVDHRNTDDVKRTIVECGVAYIGFDVPDYLMANGVPDVWTVQNVPETIVGGHAVILAGYNETAVKVISWGRTYWMTWEFFSRYTDEVYALADSSWIKANGTTPGGLTLEQLQAQMSALKG